MKSSLKYTDGLDVAVNEAVNRFVLNRSIGKLLENDIQLDALYIEAISGLGAREYTAGTTYKLDNIVWFRRKSGGKLYLLKCSWDSTDNDPELAFAGGGKPDFERYGWEDQTETSDIISLGIRERLAALAAVQLSEHQSDGTLHRFGEIGKPGSFDEKIMRADLRNANPSRKKFFFPYQTGRVRTDSITDGTYRVWDCGVLEFDLTVRFGFTGKNALGGDMLSCNNVSFSMHENQRYFQSNDDGAIFLNPPDVKIFESNVGASMQGNRNNFVNSYFAKIDMFRDPIKFGEQTIAGFADTNYMVFSQNSLSEDRMASEKAVSRGISQITFADKRLDSITAILTTFPSPGQVNFGETGGLASNSFSFQIVGRWRT